MMKKIAPWQKAGRFLLGSTLLVLLCLVVITGLRADADNLFGMSDLGYEKWLQEMEQEVARYDQPEEALEFYASQRLPAGVEALEPALYEAGEDVLEALPLFNIATGQPTQGLAPEAAPWVELGPSNVGGRTRALLIDPSTPTTMYAGAVAGGVWKSTNSGASWSLTDDFMENLAVNSLAFDPANSSIIYAGTGEGVFNADAVRGRGIFKSTNAGASWTHLTNTDTSNFYYVMDIVVSPNNSNHVYAATRTGVWKSTDAGATWAQVVNHSGANSRCLDLAIRTDVSPDTVFASCGTSGIQGAIYQTTDGTTWGSVFTEANMGRTHLAIAPSNQNTIYAIITSTAAGTYSNGLHKVIRSTTGGGLGTWSTRVDNTSATKLNTVLLSNPVFAFLLDCAFGPANQFLNQGWYDTVIAVDPTNANTLWVGGIDMFKSIDGGANWALASMWWDDTNSWYVHADQHAIVFHPNYNGVANQTMYVANDGGIYRTNAAVSGTTSTNPCSPTSTSTFGWTTLNNGYNVTQFYHGDTYPSGTTFFGGTQDNGTNRGTTASTSWTEINGGDGGYVAVDPSNTNVLFLETTNLSIRKSTNGGTTFTDSITGITESSANFQFINPFLMDPNNSQRLWTGGRTLWRTDNQGTSWTQASVTNQTGVGTNSVASWAVQPGNSDVVLAGDELGNVYRTTAGTTATNATAWTDTSNMGGYVSSIAFDPNTTTTAYATVSTFGATHLWRSTDSGATWAAFGGSLPDIPFHSVLVQPGDSTRIYVGTDRGVIVTPDGGTTWFYAQGFPRVVVEWMDIETEGGTEYLYAYTHGRSVFRTGTPVLTAVGLNQVQAESSALNLMANHWVLAAVLGLALLSLTTLWLWRRPTHTL